MLDVYSHGSETRVCIGISRQLVQPVLLDPTPEFLIQWAWAGAQEIAFVTSPNEILGATGI